MTAISIYFIAKDFITRTLRFLAAPCVIRGDRVIPIPDAPHPGHTRVRRNAYLLALRNAQNTYTRTKLYIVRVNQTAENTFASIYRSQRESGRSHNQDEKHFALLRQCIFDNSRSLFRHASRLRYHYARCYVNHVFATLM